MTVALAILAILVGLLCLPFWVELSLEEGWRFHASVHWPLLRKGALPPRLASRPLPRRLRRARSARVVPPALSCFGDDKLVDAELLGLPAFAPPDAPDERRPKQRHHRKQPARPALRKIRALVRSPDFLPSLVRLTRRLLAQLTPRHLRIRFRFGLGDPADTGRACGALAPLFVALVRFDADDIRFEPDFGRRTLELQGYAVVRIVPAVLIALVVGYCLTRAPWRALARFVSA